MNKVFCLYIEDINNTYIPLQLLAYFVKKETNILLINFFDEKQILNKLKITKNTTKYSRIFNSTIINNFLTIASIKKNNFNEDIYKKLLEQWQKEFKFIFLLTNNTNEVTHTQNTISNFIFFINALDIAENSIKKALILFNKLKTSNPEMIFSHVALFNFEKERKECILSFNQCKRVFSKIKTFETIPIDDNAINNDINYALDNFWLVYSIYLDRLYKSLIL